MMLDHLGFGEAARDLGAAVQSAVQSNQLTEEVGGSLGTREVGDFIASQLA
jgi:isocitrate/isopropylmalate dehydrogenase